MKRLVWLILAVFGTALAQVQPVDLPVIRPKVCDCCEQPGACGKADCALPPTTNPAPVLNLRSPAPVAPVAVNRAAPAPRRGKEGFYARFESRPAALPADRAPFVLAPTASVPLFKAHCRFLI